MQGARLERGCQILPNSVVQPGRLIPSGQVWGGSPATFVRDLTVEEQMQNYANSYGKGASSGAGKFSLWPRDYTSGDLPAGEDSMD